MARIIFRGLYAAFPTPALADAGVLAYATDLLQLLEWSGTAWIAYHDYPDYQGEKSGLYLEPAWAAFQAEDINLNTGAINMAFGTQVSITRLVPAGRTLYVTDFSFMARASAVADADNNQMCVGILSNISLGINFVTVGGNGGGECHLFKPVVVPAGDLVGAFVYAYANHLMHIAVNLLAYEI